jgi:hypothetical protein
MWMSDVENNVLRNNESVYISNLWGKKNVSEWHTREWLRFHCTLDSSSLQIWAICLHCKKKQLRGMW